MAEIINKNAVVIWQKAIEGVGEPALLVRCYVGNMIGIQQEDKDEVLINVETMPVLITLMKHFLAEGHFETLKV